MPEEVKKYPHCFVCGDKNPSGLKVLFFKENGYVRAEYQSQEYLEGYKGIFHGGIIATLLDEVMIKAVIAEDIVCVTRKLEVKFKKPLYIGERIILTGKIVENRGKIVKTRGEIRNTENELIAFGAGEFFVAGPELEEKLLKSLKS